MFIEIYRYFISYQINNFTQIHLRISEFTTKNFKVSVNESLLVYDAYIKQTQMAT